MSEQDIISIDEDICQIFKEEETNLNMYEKKIKEFENSLKSSSLSYRVRQKIKENYEELKKYVNDIKNKISENFYIMETAPLLEKYKKIMKNPIKLNFMGKRETNNIEKNNIIEQYLKIAKKYKPDINIQHQITQQIRDKIICSECNNKKEFHEIDNEFICLVCGNTLETTTRFSSYKDVERVNMTTKYTYDRKVHFRDCINQFQGKQNATIDDNSL